MSKALALFVVLAFILTPQPSQASFVDGNTLLQKCESTAGSATYYQDQSFCTAYILGVTDTIGYFQPAPEIEDFVCIPANVTSGQVRDVVVKFLKENPAERHKGADSITFIALALAFRCEKTE